MEQLTGLSSSLTSLALRPHPEEVTRDSLWHLAGMSQLQVLSLCPLPEVCTADDLRQLLEMPCLQQLQLGTNNAAQVCVEVRLHGNTRCCGCAKPWRSHVSVHVCSFSQHLETAQHPE